MSSRQVSTIPRDALLGVLLTVTSPVFCELVLELIGLPPQFIRSPSTFWGRWEEVDVFLQQRFGARGDFMLIIRTGQLYDQENFQRHAKAKFPLLTSMGWIRFEAPPLAGEY